MSTIRKKPFIEAEVVDKLSVAQKQALLSVMNTAGNNVAASLLEMPAKGITPVLFKFDEANLKTGILIYLDNIQPTLIAYHRFQDVLLFKLFPDKNTYEKVCEYCDINELRRILGATDTITSGDIDSGNATKGQVLTADGNHSTFWSNKVDFLVLSGESGTLTADQLALAKQDNVVAQLGDNGQYYYKNSQNNYYIVFKADARVASDSTIVEKITIDLSDNTWSYSYDVVAAGESFTPTYDNELDNASTNAPQTKVVYEALEEKANVDGNYQTMTVGLSNNFDSKLVINDDSAYVYRSTAGGEEVGSPCKVKSIVGGTIAWNQLISNGNFASTSDWTTSNASFSVSDNIATITPSTTNDKLIHNVSAISGHIYLICGDFKGNESSDVPAIFAYLNNSGNIYQLSGGASNWTTIGGVFKITSLFSVPQIQLRNTSTVASDLTFYARNLMLIDLTQMFGATVAEYIYGLEQSTAGAGVAFVRQFINKPYYEHNDGTLLSVKTSGRKITGFNQWDEEWDYNLGRVIAKNFIKCIPNTTYYFKAGEYNANKKIYFFDENQNQIGEGWAFYDRTITTPMNACYMWFELDSGYGTTYKNDICINLHWDGERDGEYEPYHTETYPIEDIELRGIPKLNENNQLAFDGDEYSHDGTVNVKYGSYTFTGSESWTINGQGYLWYDTSINAKYGSWNVSGNMICQTVSVSNHSDLYNGVVTNGICIDEDGKVVIGSDTYTNRATLLAGKTIVYELAEPTTDSATAFTETQESDNWGTEEFLAPAGDTRPVMVPVGQDTDYLPDLKAKLESAPANPANDGDYVMHREDGVNTYSALGAVLAAAGYVKLTDITGYDATKTQTLKNVSGTMTWVDD